MFEPHSALQATKKEMFLRSFVKIQYCGKSPLPRASVLGLKPQGLEFRILCLEGSVISFISLSSGVSPDPDKPICIQLSGGMYVIGIDSMSGICY